LISVLGVLGFQLAGGGPPTSMKIFWIPPEVETYIAMTADNIEAQAFKIVDIRDSGQAGDILALIKKSKQTIDGKRVRIKLSVENKSATSYIFDSNGIGVSSSGEAVQIDLNKLRMAIAH
jgi:hypothetical protein